MKVQTIYNGVLVKPDEDSNTIELSGGVKLIIADTLTTGRYHPQSGTVLGIPYTLTGIPSGRPVKENEDLNAPSEPDGEWYKPYRQYDVDIILKPGDKVFFHHNSISHTNKVDENTYKVGYNLCYMYIRDGELCMMDGWILVEKIEEDIVPTTSGIISSLNRTKEKSLFAKVVKAGNRARKERGGDTVQAGDTIVYRPHATVEMRMGPIKFGDKVYYRMRYESVECKMINY